MTTIVSGGAQYVGGTADGTSIGSGSQQTIYHRGSASGTAVHGGSQFVWGVADDTRVDNGGLQEVHGSATDTTISSGQQKIYTDGVATDTTVNADGFQFDWGTAVDTTIRRGTQDVYGFATDTTINGGVQHVEAGATASDTTINANALLHVDAGGSIHDVIFGAQGGALELAQSSALSGTISGFHRGDSIDLMDVAWSTAKLGYTANTDERGGTLTVSDGGHTATLALLGVYTAADFALTRGDHGDTLVTIAHHLQMLHATPLQV
jgi:autotransporter passenger strand-loop-strand repeat protein